MMIDKPFAAVILASSLACIVTTIGIYVISKYETWGRSNIVYFMSFTAGVLISVSFIHIIPESFQMNDAAPAYLLPEVDKENKRYSIILLAAGVLVAAIIVMAKG